MTFTINEIASKNVINYEILVFIIILNINMIILEIFVIILE